MNIKKAYKFKLKPSIDQAKQMHDIAGHCRWLWNRVLKTNLERLRSHHSLMWYYESDFWCKIWKNSEEYSYTSQKCSACKHINKDNRKTQSKFLCVRCGHAENADINAAKNILAAGRAVLACKRGSISGLCEAQNFWTWVT